MRVMLFSIIIALGFSGCSILGIGDVAEAPCDGECNFKEAGVCADAITIYTHKDRLVNRKVKKHWFAEDEDPYLESSQGKASFTRINEEDLNDY